MSVEPKVAAQLEAEKTYNENKEIPVEEHDFAGWGS